MRQYPISTLLVWKTNSKIRRRKFIDNWKSTLRLSDFYVPEDTKKKCLVLDGQQRLQSLFIALQGSYEGRELHFDILSGKVAAPDDVKYGFEFRHTAKTNFPWVKFKDLIWTTKSNRQLALEIEASAERNVTNEEKDKIGEHLELVLRTFRTEETISYQELDSLDNPELYTEDDVVEVFIRANSGGTKLGKSDLLFSLLTSTWDEADVEMDDLLEKLNRHGFGFTRDFVLKTCLTILGHGARYEVKKFRQAGVREQIESKWDAISGAIVDVLDFVRGKTFIQCNKALPTYSVLIPLIHVRYHWPEAWSDAKDIDTYVLRSSLAGAFGGSSDNLLNGLTTQLNESQLFDAAQLFGVMRSQNRSLELTEDRLWQTGYGSDAVHLLFNLWYRQFNHTPAYENNLPQIDHIFPQSLLRKVKIENERTGRLDKMKYREAERNQLPNCMLLTREENGAGGKGDTPPEEWFADKNDAYLEMHLIPKDPSLWKLDRFDDFVEKRKELIREKFANLLVQRTVTTEAVT
jgi:hypothetical protein